MKYAKAIVNIVSFDAILNLWNESTRLSIKLILHLCSYYKYYLNNWIFVAIFSNDFAACILTVMFLLFVNYWYNSNLHI